MPSGGNATVPLARVTLVRVLEREFDDAMYDPSSATFKDVADAACRKVSPSRRNQPAQPEYNGLRGPWGPSKAGCGVLQ